MTQSLQKKLSSSLEYHRVSLHTTQRHKHWTNLAHPCFILHHCLLMSAAEAEQRLGGTGKSVWQLSPREKVEQILAWPCVGLRVRLSTSRSEWRDFALTLKILFHWSVFLCCCYCCFVLLVHKSFYISKAKCTSKCKWTWIWG